jgi:hypothetical protein
LFVILAPDSKLYKMKIKLLLTTLIVGLLTSCTNDPSNNNSSNNYIPLNSGNYWKYNVSNEGNMSSDSLYVSNDTVISNKTYKKMRTKSLPVGFYSSSLNKNALRTENGSVFMTGSSGLNFGNALPININLTDFIILKENASVNETLGSVSGVLNQTLQGYPMTIDYTLKSTAMESSPSFTSPDNNVYSDIKKVKVTLNLKVTTSIVISGFTIPVVIMNSQDVVSSIQYYSKDKGMVYTKTDITYQLQNFSQFGISLPIPQSGNQVQEEFLTTFSVN